MIWFQVLKNLITNFCYFHEYFDCHTVKSKETHCSMSLQEIVNLLHEGASASYCITAGILQMKVT